MGSHKAVTRGDAHPPGEVDDFLDFTEVAAPATPATGFGRLYVATNGTLHFVDDAGTDIDLSAGGAFSPTWSTYVPDLTASVTNPTLGSGSTQEGRYVQIGDLVIVQFNIAFGTSGVNEGSGSYQVSLPVNAGGLVSSTTQAVGTAVAVDTGVGVHTFVAYLTSATDIRFYPTATGPTGSVVQNSPITWAAQDRLRGTVTYEAA